MKKLMSLVILSILLVACGKEEEAIQPTETTTEIIELDNDDNIEDDNEN